MPPPTRKPRKQYLYHDPTRLICNKCRAVFKSSIALRRHRAQLRDCQSSEDEEEYTVSRRPSEAANDPVPPIINQSVIPQATQVDADRSCAGFDNFGIDLGGDMGGDMGEDAWIDTTGMDDNSFVADGPSNLSGAHTRVPSEPSAQTRTVKEVYVDAGKIIDYGKTPYENISSHPRYRHIQSSGHLNQACYPFSGPDEIEVVDWIFSNQLSHAGVNNFLRMNYVRIKPSRYPRSDFLPPTAG